MNTSPKTRAVRRADTQNAIQRQVRILKAVRGRPLNVHQPHRLAKHHALNCGKPGCIFCSNPRHNAAVKGRGRLTRQELRALDQQAEGVQSLGE